MTFNRRQFLQNTAATGAAIATVSAANSVRAAAANDKVIVGVMGVYGRGNSLAKSFAARDDADVAYICDVDERAAARAAKTVTSVGAKKPESVKDFRKILDDKSVDVLVIAAPDHWHGPATILGCTAGKHVYVEKPACHNPREGELMIAAARKNKRTVQVGTQRRSRPKLIEGIEAVRGGAIGKVYYARSWYASARGKTEIGKAAPVPSWLDYELWQGPAPAQPYKDKLLHYKWHWFWHWGTGELGNNGVHGLDLCRWGLGVDYPTHVTSSGGRYHFKDDQETPDTHSVSFQFDGGKLITWEGLSCNRHGLAGIWDSSRKALNIQFGVTFHGDAGTLAMCDAINGYLIYDKGDKIVKEVKGTGGDADHITDFLSCIRSGEAPHADVEEGVKSTMLCNLGNIAQRVGRSVRLDPKTHQITGDEQAAALWGREYAKGWEPKV